MDFFLSKKHVNEEIFNSFLCQYFLFWVILKNPQSDFQIFTISECKDDLTGLFTSQPIAVVALSTAPAGRPRAPSAPHLSCYTSTSPSTATISMSGRKQQRAWPGLPAARPCPKPRTMGSWQPPGTTCPWGSAARPGAGEISIVSFQIKCSGSCGELCWGSENSWFHGVSSLLSHFPSFDKTLRQIVNLFSLN